MNRTLGRNCREQRLTLPLTLANHNLSLWSNPNPNLSPLGCICRGQWLPSRSDAPLGQGEWPSSENDRLSQFISARHFCVYICMVVSLSIICCIRLFLSPITLYRQLTIPDPLFYVVVVCNEGGYGYLECYQTQLHRGPTGRSQVRWRRAANFSALERLWKGTRPASILLSSDPLAFIIPLITYYASNTFILEPLSLSSNSSFEPYSKVCELATIRFPISHVVDRKKELSADTVAEAYGPDFVQQYYAGRGR